MSRMAINSVTRSKAPTAEVHCREVSEREKVVLREYASGENAGNATKAYLREYPDASYNTASVAASDLLKLPKAQEFLAELHRRATEASAARLLPWADLLPMSQAVIVATAQGRLRNRLAYEAAVYVTNRVMGAPTANHEVSVRDHAQINRALAAFTRRIADSSRRRSDGAK
jgi:hypothetical protein